MLHEAGLGAGLSVAEREDPAVQARVMVPVYRRVYETFRQSVVADPRTFAALVCCYAERPYDYQNSQGQAAANYRAAWDYVQTVWPGDVLMNDVAEEVLALGMSWAGTPYVMVPEATTRQMADCSGFVVGVFREYGRPFPAGVRDVEQIRQQCALVTSTAAGWDNGAVQRGDLLIYGYPGARGGDAHIAFALLGGQVLDARYPNGVGIHAADWPGSGLYECRRPPQYAMPLEPSEDAVQPSAGALLGVMTTCRDALADAIAVKGARGWRKVAEVATELTRNVGA